MLKDIGLIIFDVDGTLLNSVEFNYRNINETLKRLGYAYYVTKEKVVKYLGCTAEDYYRGILDDETYTQWEYIRQEVRKNTQDMMYRYGEAFPGVADTFCALEKKGIKLVLYSNCSRLYLDAAIKVTGIGPYIEYAECVKENGLEKDKLIEKILKKYPGIKAVVVGDRIHDVDAAKANDLICFGAYYGFGKDELKKSDYLLHSIDELLTFLSDK